jgi:hypothetical protein
MVLRSLKRHYSGDCIVKKLAAFTFVVLYCLAKPSVYAEYRFGNSSFIVYEIPAAAENDLELTGYHLNWVLDHQEYSDGYPRGYFQEYVFYNNGGAAHTVRLGVWCQSEGEIPSELFMIDGVKVSHQLDYANNIGLASVGFFAFIDVVFPAKKETKIKVDDLSYIRHNKDDKFIFKGSPRFTATIGNHFMDRFRPYFEIEEYWINDIFFNNLGEESLVSILEQKGSLSNDLFCIRKTNANTWEIAFTKKFVDGHRSNLTFEVESGLWGDIEGPGNSGGLQFNSEEKITPYQYIFLTDKQLQVARNAYYARHGYIFKNPAMGRMMYEDFRAPSFGNINYKENPNFSESMLTDTDRANIAIIQKLEEIKKLTPCDILNAGEDEKKITPSNAVTNRLPVWAAIIGGIVIAAGPTVFIVKRKK